MCTCKIQNFIYVQIKIFQNSFVITSNLDWFKEGHIIKWSENEDTSSMMYMEKDLKWTFWCIDFDKSFTIKLYQ